MFYLGDCFKILPSFADASVDMVLCDPPYNTVNWTKPNTWDKALPLAPLWGEIWRVLKPKGAVLLFGNEPFSTLLRHSALSYYKYDYIWVKSRAGGFANAKVKPLKQYENISVFSKGTTSPGRNNNMPYFPQGLVRVNKEVKNSGGSRMGIQVRDNAPDTYIQEFTNYPNDILEFSNETGLHPTQKPVPLCEHLIRTYSNEGATVLDMCMGSGTTGVAAARAKRKFIGIEKEREYYDLATMRVLGEFLNAT